MPNTKDPASLENLRDIVESLPVSLWWPLAPGWWIVSIALVLIGSWLGWRWWRRWRADAYRREALRELEQMEDPIKLTGLLKRVALATYPREEVAGLSGDRWIDFLNNSASVAHFDAGTAQLMATLEYMPRQASKSTDADLFSAAKRWIESHKPSNLPHISTSSSSSSSYSSSERSDKLEDDTRVVSG